MKTLSQTVYKLSCEQCKFTREVTELSEVMEEVEDHLHEPPEDDYGYRNWGHIVQVQEIKRFTLDWAGTGSFQR